MTCNNQNVPTYLHWNDRKVYNDTDFLYYHKLYRLKTVNNPIEIPEKYSNAVSCRWSKIVKEKHINVEPPKPHYVDYDYVFLQEIRNYKKIGILDNKQHTYSGKHVLTCIMHHDPNACDYSHSEILIRHQVFNEKEVMIFDETYTAKDWSDKAAMLNKEGGKFFKGLKKAFRLDMIKLISRSSKENGIIQNIRAFCRVVKLNQNINPIFDLEGS